MFQYLRPGHTAVVLGVIVIGKIVGVVPAVPLGSVRGNAVHRTAAAAAAGDDVRPQILQMLAACNGQIAGHNQNTGVAGGGTADGQRRAKAAGAGFHHRHIGLQLAALGGKGQHCLGKAVLGGAGCAAEIQIGKDARLQPVTAGIAVQPHNRGTVDLLIIAVQNRHAGTPRFR